MARRYFNWALAVVLVVAIAVFAGAVFALHAWQKNSGAEKALPLGRQAYDEGNWDEAATHLGDYLGVHGDDTEVLLKYAEAQRKRRPVQAGPIQRAMNAYQAVLRIEKNNEETAKWLAELYLAMNNPLAAEALTSDFLRNNDSPTLKRILARSQAQLRKFREAGSTLAELVTDHPEDVLAYELLGQLAKGHPEEVNKPAAQWFDEAVAANPQSALAYTVRGAFYRQQGWRDQALVEFDEAGTHDLSATDVHLRLIQELIGARAYDKAQEHLEALQATAPAEPVLWESWAAVRLASGSSDEQAATAEMGLKALDRYPWDFMPAATELFIAAGRQEKARECISQMREKGFPSSLLLFLQGLVASSEGRLWEAITSWQEAIVQGHKVHTYAGRLGDTVPVRMMVASSMARLGDTQSAGAQLRTLISEIPGYVGLSDAGRTALTIQGRMELARLLAHMGDWTGVLDQVSEVQQVVPGYTEAGLLGLQARISLVDAGDELAGDPEAAWQEIERQLAGLEQATGGAAPVKILAVQVAIKRGRFAEAEKTLEDVKSKYPSDLRVALLEVELLTAQEKSQEAVALLRRLIGQFPQRIEPVRMLALMLNSQKEWAQCELLVRETIARMGRPEAKLELGLLLADLYRRWAREDDLYRWLTEMAVEYPNDIQAKRRLLACSALAQDIPQAQKLVDQIKAIEGEAGWQWRYEQARVWFNSDGFEGHYTQIVQYLQQNLRANSGDQASRMLLAMTYEKHGQLQLALSLYREAIKRSPGDINVIMRTVAALYKAQGAAGQDEAEQYLAAAREHQLSHPDLEKLELYGQRLRWRDQVRRGALGPASETLKQLVRRDPNDVGASLSLALISMRQGRLDEAEVILKELRNKAPDSIPVIQAQTRLYILQDNVSEALRLCNEAVQKRDDALAYILRAWTYAGMMENEKAMEDFDRAVARDPNNAGIRVDRANFYQSIGRRPEAIADIRNALNLSPLPPTLLDPIIRVARDLGSRSLLSDVEATLDKARGANPNQPGLKLLKAELLLPRGIRPAIEQAQQLLQEATAAQPDLAQAWHLLGRLELGQGQPGKAWDTALGGLSHNGNNRQLLLLKADAEAARSPAQAVPTLKLLAGKYPDDMDVEMRLVSALYKSGSRDDARSLLDARAKAEPNNPIPVVTFADLLAQEGRWSEVAEQTTRWVAKHPQDVGVVTTVARSLTATGDAEALQLAESLLHDAVERNPTSVSAVAAMALLMQNMGRSADTAALSRKVLELDPNNVTAMNNLAWILSEENGRYEEALQLAERGLKIMPEYLDLIDTRGVIRYRLGRYEDAVADFSRCLELYPANAPAAVATCFHLARAYYKMDRRADAEEYLRQAMDLHGRMGGLTPADLAEAKLLQEQMQKGR